MSYFSFEKKILNSQRLEIQQSLQFTCHLIEFTPSLYIHSTFLFSFHFVLFKENNQNKQSTHKNIRSATEAFLHCQALLKNRNKL